MNKKHLVSAAALLACITASSSNAQRVRDPAPPADSYEGHLYAAKQAAGFDFTGTLARLCVAPSSSVESGNRGQPVRADWYAEPVRMFDNLYWLGTKVHSSWALANKDGIIIIDTLFNYAAQDEIVDGLKKLGLDPRKIKYVIISHGHSDHDEGARLLQDQFGAHVVMGGPDWDLIDHTENMPGGKPRKDITAADGQKISVGDNIVTIVSTPGHTAGTLSMFFTVRDHGKPLTVAYSGGTSNIPLVHNPAGLLEYINSQRKMAKMASELGASVLMTNHSEFDSAYIKSRLLAARKPGERHPYDVGTDGVQRYFKLGDECAQATRMKAMGY
jgi:metallo-beta-lactamase class B